jgi:hypothetical protein
VKGKKEIKREASGHSDLSAWDMSAQWRHPHYEKMLITTEMAIDNSFKLLSVVVLESLHIVKYDI